MKEQFIVEYKEVAGLFELHNMFLNTMQDVVKNNGNPVELADMAFALREMSKLFKDMEKDTRILGELAEKMACLKWMVAGGDEDNIKTDYCTATPDMKHIAAIPKREKDPEAFAALMKHFNIPESAFPGEDEDIVRPHWPGVVSALSKAMQEGKPLPKGIDPTKTYPHYRLTIRKRKDIDS